MERILSFREELVVIETDCLLHRRKLRRGSESRYDGGRTSFSYQPTFGSMGLFPRN